MATCLACALQGCAFFSRKPPLPKHASIEHVGKPVPGTDFVALVEHADVIYFPADRAASGGRSEPAALLLEVLQQSGKPFAIAWDLIDARQQELLEELPAADDGRREEIIGSLQLGGTGRAREHCRSVLRKQRGPGARFLALHYPTVLAEKIALGGRLAAEEEQFLPRGFVPPLGGFEAFAERLSTTRGASERSVIASYRMEVMRQQFAAEAIVRHFRSFGEGGKLLVFSSGADLDSGRGVPFYVAQKLPLRQVVLGADAREPSRAKLLTRNGGNLGRKFEVVDRAPIAARD